MGLFIQVEIDQEKLLPDVCRQLVDLCPVDIFAMQDEQLTVVSENEDECTFCELCLKYAPVGAIAIRKLYKDETLVS